MTFNHLTTISKKSTLTTDLKFDKLLTFFYFQSLIQHPLPLCHVTQVVNFEGFNFGLILHLILGKVTKVLHFRSYQQET